MHDAAVDNTVAAAADVVGDEDRTWNEQKNSLKCIYEVNNGEREKVGGNFFVILPEMNAFKIIKISS